MSSSPVPQALHTQDGQIVALSRGFTELTGYTLVDVPTTLAWFVTGCRLDRADAAARLEALAARLGIPTEVEIFTKDGARRRWIVHPPATFEGDDGHLYAVSTALDVTERAAAELALAAKTRLIERIFDTNPGVLYVFDIVRKLPAASASTSC